MFHISRLGRAAGAVVVALTSVAAMTVSVNADSIAAWGNDVYGQVSNAPTGTGYTTIAGGDYSGYALRANGSIAAWGWNGYGQVSNVPTDTGYTAISVS
ncbi:MAG: hypothetical protein ACYC26_17760, partial [Phycisphaerales bacterium]